MKLSKFIEDVEAVGVPINLVEDEVKYQFSRSLEQQFSRMQPTSSEEAITVLFCWRMSTQGSCFWTRVALLLEDLKRGLIQPITKPTLEMIFHNRQEQKDNINQHVNKHTSHSHLTLIKGGKN